MNKKVGDSNKARGESDNKVALLKAYAVCLRIRMSFSTFHVRASQARIRPPPTYQGNGQGPGWDPVKRRSEDSLKNRIAKLPTDVEKPPRNRPN